MFSVNINLTMNYKVFQDQNIFRMVMVFVRSRSFGLHVLMRSLSVCSLISKITAWMEIILWSWINRNNSNIIFLKMNKYPVSNFVSICCWTFSGHRHDHSHKILLFRGGARDRCRRDENSRWELLSTTYNTSTFY